MASRRLGGMTLVLLAGVLAAADEKPAPADAPPPLEFQLEVDGKTHAVQTDRPFEIEIGGSKVRMRLTPQPYRVFDREGLRFHYPASHGWEVDREDPACTIWSLDGNDNIVMVIRYTNPGVREEVHASAVKGIVEQFGGRENVRQSPVTARMGTTDMNGTRVEVSLLDQALRQDIYTFSTDGATYSLIIQDMPEDGKPTEETRQVVEMLQKTFEIVPKGK